MEKGKWCSELGRCIWSSQTGEEVLSFLHFMIVIIGSPEGQPRKGKWRFLGDFRFDGTTCWHEQRAIAIPRPDSSLPSRLFHSSSPRGGRCSSGPAPRSARQRIISPRGPICSRARARESPPALASLGADGARPLRPATLRCLPNRQ